MTAPERGKIDLGLGSLDEFTPADRPAPEPSERAIVDRTAREQGFGKPSIPSEPPRRARRAAGEQYHQINVRGPLSVMDRFVKYCDGERVAYWEAIDRFLKTRGK